MAQPSASTTRLVPKRFGVRASSGTLRWLVIIVGAVVAASCESGACQQPSPLENFEKLVAQSWEVTAATGRKMIHTWKWGPGKNSIERWTEGESASGDPWKELAVYYWHPTEQKIKLLGISPFAAGINQGTIEFDGVSATIQSTLVQTSATRAMVTRWSFKDPNHYVETLLEKDSAGKLFELVSLNHHRVERRILEQQIPQLQTEILPQFKFIEPFIGESWVSQTDAVRSSFRWSLKWIPVANYCYGSVREIADGNAEDAAHFYIYRGNDSKSLRVLAVCSNAEVLAGEVRESDTGSVQFELERVSTLTKENIVSLFEMRGDGDLKQTVQLSTATKTSEPRTIIHRR